jgi:hypothetical protein
VTGEVSLEAEDFRQVLQSPKYREAHQAAMRLACEEAGFTAVPAYVVGQRVLTGLQSKQMLEQVIDAEREKQHVGTVPGAHCSREGRQTQSTISPRRTSGFQDTRGVCEFTRMYLVQPTSRAKVGESSESPA